MKLNIDLSVVTCFLKRDFKIHVGRESLAAMSHVTRSSSRLAFLSILYHAQKFIDKLAIIFREISNPARKNCCCLICRKALMLIGNLVDGVF